MSELVLEKNIDTLPKGWILSRIQDIVLNPKNDIVDGPFGSNLKATEYVDNGIPIIRLQNVDRNQFINKNIRYVTKEKAKQLKRHSFLKNDIVITKLGFPVGKATLVPEYLENGIIVADILRMRVLDKFVSRKFLTYLINSEIITKQFTNHTQGTTRPRVNLTKFRDFILPLPPLNEQKRMVAKIEEMFSLIDNYKETVTHILERTDSFFESYLKRLFKGDITEHWRKNHPSSDTVKNLFELKFSRISKNKRKHLIDKTVLPLLPTNWDWGNFDLIAEDTPNAIKAGPFGSALKKEFYVSNGFKIYGQEQVIRNDPSYGDYYVNEKKFLELKSCEVKPYDFLISLVGTIGKTLVLPENIEKGVINPRLIKISLDKKTINPQFLQIYFQSNVAKTFFKISSHGGTMDILNMSILKNLPIPVPPIEEQKEILIQYEKEFSLINNMKKILFTNQNLVLQLKNKVLQKAFEGKLVPQDPNDEPAEILLEKIKQEKQKIISQIKRGKKNVK